MNKHIYLKKGFNGIFVTNKILGMGGALSIVENH